MSFVTDNTLEPVEPLPFPLQARTATPSVDFVIPAFNEELVLPLTYGRIVEVMDPLDVGWTVTFVNDGSRDGTVGVLERLHAADPRVSYLALSRNFGHQAALSAGL